MAKKYIKSRYKICFQTQNKVWIYKNSRLRNFYKIRGKIVLLQGKINKDFLITNNMKWRVVRRKMVPYIRIKNRFRFHYKNLFFNKQQLKNFYGSIQEYKLRNIFKKTWNVNLFYRRNIFIGALEQRINMVLFRMRLLPTIFACTQFIMHKGIYANNVLITLPSYRIKIGEIISIPENQWLIFYKFLYERIYNRFFGEALLIYRKDCSLRKIQYYRLRSKKFFAKNFKLFKRYGKCKKRFFFIKKFIKRLLLVLHKNKSLVFKHYKILCYIQIYFNNTLWIQLFKIQRNLKKIRRWNLKNIYTKNMHYLVHKLYAIEVLLKKIQYFLIRYILAACILKKEKFNYSNFEFFDVILKLKKKELKKKKLLHLYWNVSYKKLLHIKQKNIRYKKRLLFLLKRFKYRKKKKRIFKTWCSQTHWYTPSYLEIDYTTLRSVFVYYPEAHEIFFGFPCSFNKIISFYKERAL